MKHILTTIRDGLVFTFSMGVILGIILILGGCSFMEQKDAYNRTRWQQMMLFPTHANGRPLNWNHGGNVYSCWNSQCVGGPQSGTYVRAISAPSQYGISEAYRLYGPIETVR